MSDDLLPVDGHVHDARRLVEGRTLVNLDAVDFAPIQAALTALAEAARHCAGLIAADGRTGSAGSRLLSQTAERWRAFESVVVSAGVVSTDLTTNALLLTYDNELSMAEKRVAVVYELWDLISHHRRGRFADAAGLDMLANQADAAVEMVQALTASESPPTGDTGEAEKRHDPALAYHTLLVYAAKELKGYGREAVEVLCDSNGSLTNANFALAMRWNDGFDNGKWSSLQSRLNKKLKGRKRLADTILA